MKPSADDAPPVIRGDGILLRPLGPDDAGALLALFGDGQVTRWTSLDRFEDEAAARAMIEKIGNDFAAGTRQQWGIVEPDGGAGEVVGTAILAQLDRRHRRAEVGYAVRRSHWGRRIVSRMLPLLIEHAFGALDLHRLEASVDPENAASLRALERNGFRREGHQRERFYQEAAWHDALVLGLLRREWRRDGSERWRSGEVEHQPERLPLPGPEGTETAPVEREQILDPEPLREEN